MPRLGCDSRADKPPVNIADRVFDLRNRVTWLKHVEFCLLGDQSERLAKVKVERHDAEKGNNDLRKQLKTLSYQSVTKHLPQAIINQSEKNSTLVDAIELSDDKRNRAMREHNRLLFIRQSLLDQLSSIRENLHRIDKNHTELIPSKDIKDISRRLREVQDRLTSVKLINKTLNTCKQHLQCDLDLLRKELPNAQRDIGQKFNQRIILKKEFLDITAENKQRLKAYQQLLDHTEAQARQRRSIHEQAMASVAEQLEDQYQTQMIVNEMTTSFESRKLSTVPDLQQKKPAVMSPDEVVEVRCMYDQFCNIIKAGLPVDIAHSQHFKMIVDQVSVTTAAMSTMTMRMAEEKDQLNRQMNRTNKLLHLIEMSMNLKNDARQKILHTMLEQRQGLELLHANDTVEEQNRILRQINDFVIVLSKALCEHGGAQLLIDPPTEMIERLRYVFDFVSRTVKTITSEPIEDDDRPMSPVIRRSAVEDSSHQLRRNSRMLIVK